MFASAVRLSAALARPTAGAAAVASTATTAGLKTSAVTALKATTTMRNLDGRLWSKNRLQVLLDASAPMPAAREPNWVNRAARNRDAKDLAGC